MGLTRLAQDPWSESHTVPTYVPPPFEVKSHHVPLTAERAEELVKTHLERNGHSLGRNQQELADGDAGRSTADGSSSRRSSVDLPGHLTDASSRHGSSALAKRVLPPAGISLHILGPYDVGLPTFRAIQASSSGAETEGNVPGDLHGASTPMGRLPQHKPRDPKAVDAWMRAGHGHDFTFVSVAAVGHGGAARCSPKTSNGPAPLSRRLSCPEGLMAIHVAASGGAADVDHEAAAAAASPPQDALEPLANNHLWMFNRGRFDSGGQGLLYSASGVLRGESHNERVASGWQPRDAASIISVHTGGDWDALPVKGGRLGRLMRDGGSPDAVRHLAAVIIQSYCRGWQVRRRVAKMRAERRGEEAARRNAEAAAAALTRERAEVRRRLRVAAKDCLLAVQAQQDYDRTRSRLAAARGLGPGAAASPPPPPPSIPYALWERCKALGQDPIQVLLDGGMLSQQIEEIIAASKLATQLPKRAALVATRLGVSLVQDRTDGDAEPLRNIHSAGSPAGAVAMIKGGSASDDGGASTASASTSALSVAPAATPRRLSLPGRAAMPLSRPGQLLARQSLGSGSAAAPGPGQGQGQGQGLQPTVQVSTSQLVEQLLSQQRLHQPQLHQQLHYQQQSRQLQDGSASGGGGGSGSGMGLTQVPAVRRNSQGSTPAALAAASQPLLRRQPSPSRAAMPPDPARTAGVAGAAPSMNGVGSGGGAGAGSGHSGTAGFMPGVPAVSPLRGLSVNMGQQLPPSLRPQQVSPPYPYHAGSGKASGIPSYGVPPGMGKRNSRRMSDFVGSSGGGAASAGTAAAAVPSLSLAAVGSSAVVLSPPEQRFPARTRSLGTSESGVAAAGLALTSAASLPSQPMPAPMRIVLPAVPLPAGSVAATQAGSGGGSDTDKAATAAGAVAVAVPCGASDGNGGGATAVSALAGSTSVSSARPMGPWAGGLQAQSPGAVFQPQPPSPITTAAAAQPQQQPQQSVQQAQSAYPQSAYPQDLFVASAGGSPIAQLGQLSPGSLPNDGTTLRRRHSYVGSAAAAGEVAATSSGLLASGLSSAPGSSFSMGAAPGASVGLSIAGSGGTSGGSIRTSISGGMLSEHSSGGMALGGGGGGAAALAPLGRISAAGGGLGGGSARGTATTNSPNTSVHGGAALQGGASSGGALPTVLPPLLQSYGSLGALLNGAGSGSSSGTASPSAASMATAPGSAAAAHAAMLADTPSGRVRRASNLAPPTVSTPPPGGAAAVVTAAPPPGAPPASGSPILFRRLQSLSSTSTSASGSIAVAATSALSAVTLSSAPFTTGGAAAASSAAVPAHAASHVCGDAFTASATGGGSGEAAGAQPYIRSGPLLPVSRPLAPLLPASGSPSRAAA